MRVLASALTALLVLAGAAFAAEAEGHIRKIDRDAFTITLDNGISYKLPPEFDIDSIKEGMDVVLAYDKIDGQNTITDMQLPQ